MAWIVIVEEESIKSEQGPSKINPIIINILNTLSASDAENFITYSLRYGKSA